MKFILESNMSYFILTYDQQEFPIEIKDIMKKREENSELENEI